MNSAGNFLSHWWASYLWSLAHLFNYMQLPQPNQPLHSSLGGVTLQTKEQKLKKSLILLILCFSSLTSAASKPFTVYSMQGLSCGKYIQDVNDNPQAKNAYGWWVSGFITGLNLLRERVTTTDQEGHNAWLLKYCSEYPLKLFIDAAIALDKELKSKLNYRCARHWSNQR